MSERPNTIFRLIPLLVDLLVLAGYVFLVPRLGVLITEQSGWNHIILLPGYLLLMIGVIAVRMLPGYSVDEQKDPGVFAVVLVFVLVVIFSMLYTGATNLGGSRKGNDTVAAGIFFVFLIPFLSSFLWPVQRLTAGTRKAYIVESISLAIVGYFSIIGAGVWVSFSSMEGAPPPAPVAGIEDLMLFVILLPVYVVFFGLPRVYLFLSTRNHRGFAIYLAGTAIFLWNHMPAAN